ncbi:MAG: hypothetical protein R3A80_06840 [Bdellovibrionota bacterium]
MEKLIALWIYFFAILVHADEHSDRKDMIIKQITEYRIAISESKDPSQRKMLEELLATYTRNGVSSGIILSEDVKNAEKAAIRTDDELFLSDIKDLESEIKSLPGLSRDKRNAALYVLETRVRNLRKNGSPEKVNAILERYSENRIFRCTDLSLNSGYVFCSDNFFCKKSSSVDAEELAGYPENVRQIILSRMISPGEESAEGAH